jgi:branched-chain amino acid transport system substrate-binding protein
MTVRISKRSAAAGIGVVVLLATGCGSSSKSTTPTTASPSTGAPTGAASGASTSAPSGGAANTASDVGVTPTTITLGYITSVTGDSSSNFADGVQGAEARIDEQNAQGGVNGRKLVLDTVDDQSTPAGASTAAHVLVQQKKVFGVIPYSAFTFGAAPYLAQQGIPVTGYGFDGPEWASPADSNMFTYQPAVDTNIAGQYFGYDFYGKFLQQVGVTKVAGMAYGISTSSQDSIHALFTSAAMHGISQCYANYSVPFGGVDFTAAALAIKSAGCNGIVGSFVDSSDVAMSTAAKQGGINAKQLYFTGYDQTTLASSANQQAYDGDYFSNYVDLDPSLPSNAAMYAAFAKYIPGYKAGLPDFGLLGSYISTDLMIKGLESAGQNPTRKSFITNLHQVTNYTAGGILPSAISFAGFGTPAMVPTTSCEYFFQLSNGKFVDAAPGGTGAVCGNRFSFKP